MPMTPMETRLTPMPSCLRSGQTHHLALHLLQLRTMGFTGPHSSRFPQVARPGCVLCRTVRLPHVTTRHMYAGTVRAGGRDLVVMSVARYVGVESSQSPALPRRTVLCTRYSHGHRHGRFRHPTPSIPSCCCREWNAPQLSFWVVLACQILAATTIDGMVQHGIGIGIAIIGAFAYMGAGT